jgi:protein-S-isoprenylcysteine O-methyltransferase Ste14
MLLDALELRVPPLALTAAAAITVALVPALHPPFVASTLSWSLGGAVIGCGAAIALLGVIAFRRARTTVDPRYPERSNAVVQSGVYAWTRNPMYVGFVAFLLGLSFGMQSLPGMAVTALVALYLHRFQVLPEERWLRQRFGGAFSNYCARVPRWL